MLCARAYAAYGLRLIRVGLVMCIQDRLVVLSVLNILSLLRMLGVLIPLSLLRVMRVL